MALRPEIALGVRAPDVGRAFSNALLNVQAIEGIRQGREQEPLRNRLLEAQVGTAEAGQTQAQQLNRIRSLAVFGTDIAQDIQGGDLASIRAKTAQRIAQDLPNQGLPSNDSQELLRLIDDPAIPEQEKLNQISQLSQQAITNAQRFGVLKAPTSADRAKFIGTPSRVERDGKSFLSGIVQNTDGSFSAQEVPIGGEFVSILGETAAEQEARVIREAGGKTAAVLTAEQELKPGVEAAVTTAVGAAEAATEIGAADLAAKRLATDESKIKNEQEKLELIGAKEAAISEATNAIGRIDGLLLGDRFASGFGKLVSSTPEILRSQEAIDVIAELDQIRGLVSLESRQKLKGQGTISDSESKTLEKSATVLSSPLISDDLAKKELKKIKGVFERSAKRNALSKSTREGRLVKQPEQQGVAQGMIDNGDGTFTLSDGRIVRRKGG